VRLDELATPALLVDLLAPQVLLDHKEIWGLLVLLEQQVQKDLPALRLQLALLDRKDLPDPKVLLDLQGHLALRAMLVLLVPLGLLALQALFPALQELPEHKVFKALLDQPE
jgi:hypothetical protein